MLNKRGFTLIELLVTISIIAILSTIGMVVYGQATMTARDARRKLDLQNIAQALEVYYQKNNSYPLVNWGYSSPTGWTIPGLDHNYISSLPIDPQANAGKPIQGQTVADSFGYTYWAWATNSWPGCPAQGQFYALVARLENPNDSDRMAVKHYKWCNGAQLDTAYGWSANAYVVTAKP